MKILAISDHFVRKEYLEECFSRYPEYELKVVYFGNTGPSWKALLLKSLDTCGYFSFSKTDSVEDCIRLISLTHSSSVYSSIRSSIHSFIQPVWMIMIGYTLNKELGSDGTNQDRL